MIVGIEVRVEALLLFVLEEARTLVGFQLRLCQLRQFSRTHPCHISLVERLAVVEVFLLIIATYVAIALRLISNSASGTSSHARVVVGGADGFVIVMRFAMWLPITGFVVELGYQVASAYLPQLALDGTTPNQYIINCRVQKAKELLLNGASVERACAESGFNNLSHFSRIFKSKVGQSPKQYQKDQRNKPIRRE